MKQDQTMTFQEFIDQDDSYFSEGHLTGWFASKYRGNTKSEIKLELETQHDNSLEIENCEQEIGRKLTDKEEAKLLKRFFKAVYNSIEWKRGIAVAYYDSLDKLNFD